jgi:hypothetical protein
MRSKVETMKDVARMILRHFDGIVAWAQTRQTNGFIEAINAASCCAAVRPPHPQRRLSTTIARTNGGLIRTLASQVAEIRISAGFRPFFVTIL